MPTSKQSPLQSKKFLAFLIALFGLDAMFIAVIGWAWNLDEMALLPFLLLLTMVLTRGFIAVGYILGVAQLEKYTRLAQIAVSAGGGTNGTANRVLSKATKGLVQVDETASDTSDTSDEEEDLEP